jgi:hypothetical protein
MKIRIYISVILICFCSVLKSQEADSSSFSLNADFVSRYAWRGLLLSASPNIQPYASLTKGQFTFGTWGSYGLNDNYAEIDLYVQWQYKNFGLAVYDYCAMSETVGESKFFNFRNKETLHSFEATASLQISENFPLNISASSFFYGYDRDSTGNLYSTYMELSYPLSRSGYDFNFFVGGTPAKGMYADKAGFVNIGATASKTIKVTDNFEMPVSLQLSANPLANYAYLVFSISI